MAADSASWLGLVTSWASRPADIARGDSIGCRLPWRAIRVKISAVRVMQCRAGRVDVVVSRVCTWGIDRWLVGLDVGDS